MSTCPRCARQIPGPGAAALAVLVGACPRCHEDDVRTEQVCDSAACTLAEIDDCFGGLDYSPLSLDEEVARA